MGKKGGTNFASMVGWIGCFLMFSAFLIWAFDDGAYSWLQNPSPNTGAMQSAVRSGLFRNVSMIQHRQYDEGVSWGKSERNTVAEYIAENMTGTLSHQDVSGSNPGTGNMSANHMPRGSKGIDTSTAERYVAENVTGTLLHQDGNGSNPGTGNMSANHVPRGSKGINTSTAERYVAENVTGILLHQDGNGSNPGTSNMSANDMPRGSKGTNISTAERYVAENVTGTLLHQDGNGSNPGTANMSANHVPRRGGRGNNISMAEKSIAENVTGTLSHQDVNGSNPGTGNISANHVPRVGRGINISMAEPSFPSAGMQRQCDLFKGRWVYDKSYVLYLPGSCSYANIDFNCRKNGRMDSDFERWRWQPQDCELPRFNASLMLERLRNKRLVYVGDSISRNQWESMLCLLRAVVPDHETTHKSADNSKSIQYFLKAYNCSIELSWAPFLVRQNSVRALNGSTVKETLQLDRIDEQAKRWKHADILVFNTGHWWTHEEPYNGVDYFEEKRHVIPHMEELVAFEKALRTWARWIDHNIDPQNTQVFFRGFSPVHFHGQAWGKKVGGGCFKETEPIHKKIEKKIERIYGERKRMQVVEKVVAKTKNVRVKLLNVTQLSMHRKDAHASVYTSKLKYMTNENDYSIVDCSHWCLPGLPDVWNNILYALII